MPHIAYRIVAVLLCALCASVVDSHAAAHPGDSRNAATWYQRAIEQYNRLSREEQLRIFDYNPSEPPSPELRAALAKVSGAMSTFQRGAMQEYSDFGLDFGEGIGMLAPHLGPMREISRAMLADAMVRLHDGDPATAAQRMATIYRSSIHFADDGTTISSLVGTSACAIADNAVQRAMDHAAVGPAEAAILLREVKRLQEMRDPFNYIGAAAGEQVLIVNWLDDVINIEDPLERMGQLFSLDDFGGEEGLPEYVQQLATMDRAEFEVAVEQFDAMTDRVIEVMSMDDPEAARAAINELGAEIVAGDFGPLGMLSPHWATVLNRKLHIEEMLAKRVESLRAIVEEEVHPEEVANAAVWYGRAIEMLSRLDPEELDLLREFTAQEEIEADKDDHTAGRKLEPLLMLSQNVIDVVREGSMKRRCDFSIIWTHVPGPAPSYTPGMRDLFRLVHADALRLMRLRKFDDAADRLAIGYRMIGHLSGDPYVISSLIAHRAHLEAHSLLEAAFEAEQLGDEDRSTVLSAFERVDAGDPFGYLASHRKLRDNLTANAERADQRIRELARTDSVPTQYAPAAASDDDESLALSSVAMVERASDDTLFYYLSLIEYSWHPESVSRTEHNSEEAQEAERARVAALHDVLDLDELMKVRAEGPVFGERWRSHTGPMFRGYETRQLNLLSDRRTSARADLRATSRLLRQAVPHSGESGPQP